MITPNFLLADQRYNNSPGIDPYAYNPQSMGGYDPMQAMLMNQLMAKQLFGMQNPKLMLSQNFGQTVGARLGQSVNNMVNNEEDQAPKQTSADPAGPGQGPGGQPKFAAAQWMQQEQQRLIANGTPANKALYQAATSLISNPAFQGDPMTQLIADHALVHATKELSYNPIEDPEYKTKQEALGKSAENFYQPQTGARVSAIPGTPMYMKLANPQSGWVRAENTPQLTPGAIEKTTRNGMNATYQVDSQGGLDISGKPAISSTQPFQAAVNMSGTPDEMQQAGVHIPGLMTNSGYDKEATDLSNRASATQDAIRAIDKVTGMVNNDPASVGKSGDVLESINNWRSTVKGLASTITGKDYSMSTQFAKESAPILDRLRQKGIDATTFNSAITDLAYVIEKAQGNTNTDPASRKSRIDQIKEDLLADRSSDPLAVTKALGMQRDNLIERLNDAYDNSPNKNLRQSKPQFLLDENMQANGNKDWGFAPAGQVMGKLKKGDKYMGHTYKGGDFKDPSNWE